MNVNPKQTIQTISSRVSWIWPCIRHEDRLIVWHRYSLLLSNPENPQNISKTIPSQKTIMHQKHWPPESKHKYHTKVSIRGGNKATIICLQKIPKRNSTGTLPVRVGPYYCCRCDIIAWIMSCPIVRRLAGHVLHNITPTASPNFNTIIRGGEGVTKSTTYAIKPSPKQWHKPNPRHGLHPPDSVSGTAAAWVLASAWCQDVFPIRVWLGPTVGGRRAGKRKPNKRIVALDFD